MSERIANVRAALFDLDGTLVDSLPSVAAAMAQAMRDHGFEADPAAIVPLIGPPMNLLVEQITGTPPEVAGRVNEDFMRLYYGEYIQHTAPLPGAGELLDALAAAGVPLGIVTNKVESGGRQMLAVQGWAERFPVVAGRDTAARPKPFPDGALWVLGQLGVAPEDAAIVGDTEYDMQCGRDAGIRLVIGVVAERSEEDLREAGATHIVHHLAEVRPLLLREVAA